MMTIAVATNSLARETVVTMTGETMFYFSKKKSLGETTASKDQPDVEMITERSAAETTTMNLLETTAA